MAIKFKYNGNIYSYSDAVRQAIWEKEFVAFGELSDEVMQKFGVEKIEYNPDDEVPDEQIAARVRTQRDYLLSKTDFYLMPDYEITPENLNAIKDYRKQLRDLPTQLGFPRKIDWPVFPIALAKHNK